MRSVFSFRVHHAIAATVAAAALLVCAAPVCAQGFGIGPRLAWVTRDVDADVDRVRFVGGQVRLISARFGLEVSMDRKSESFELLNQKVTETPVQAALLMRLGSGSVAPVQLGGPGGYRRKAEPLDGSADLGANTTEFGWHAGIGLEIRPHRHLGIHGDYRYTFLDFKEDDDEDEGFIGGLLPGHRGSMWTLGATIYF
jgi:hypothetical protein